MAQAITIFVWKGAKQVYGRPDRITSAAVRKIKSTSAPGYGRFTGSADTGRFQIKCGAQRVDEVFELVSQQPGIVVLDSEPDGDPLTWRDRPVSAAQRDLLDRLNIDLPADANRGIASDLIDAALN